MFYVIVAYMYARFRYSGKNPMRFAAFWRISVRFCGFRTPLTPPSLLIHEYNLSFNKVYVRFRFRGLEGVEMISSIKIYWLSYAVIRMICLNTGRARF